MSETATVVESGAKYLHVRDDDGKMRQTLNRVITENDQLLFTHEKTPAALLRLFAMHPEKCLRAIRPEPLGQATTERK